MVAIVGLERTRGMVVHPVGAASHGSLEKQPCLVRACAGLPLPGQRPWIRGGTLLRGGILPGEMQPMPLKRAATLIFILEVKFLIFLAKTRITG